MQTPRWKRIRGKAGYVTGLIQVTEESDRHDSPTDEWKTAYQIRTDSEDDLDDEADRREARAALEDFDRDRRMQNHRKPLAATKEPAKGKQKKRPQGATVPRRDGISADAARRMANHLQPLKFSK